PSRYHAENARSHGSNPKPANDKTSRFSCRHLLEHERWSCSRSVRFHTQTSLVRSDVLVRHLVRRECDGASASASAKVFASSGVLNQTVESIDKAGRVIWRDENGRAVPDFAQAGNVAKYQGAAAQARFKRR